MIYFHMTTITDYQVTNRYNDKSAGVGNWKKYFRTFCKYLLISTIGNTSPTFWVRQINEWLKKTDYETSEYVGFLAGGYYGTKEIVEHDVFREQIPVSFEGYTLFAPIGYDIYLKHLYGNYMELPPVEKRCSHHEFKAYWLDENDTNYL